MKRPNSRNVTAGLALRDLPQRSGVLFAQDIPIDFAFWVDGDRLVVTANDKVIYDWKGGFQGMRPPRSRALFSIGGHHPARFRFRKITLEPDVKFPDLPSDKEP